MPKKIFIGIDNGVSGTIGMIGGKKNIFMKTPTKSCLKYTKKKANITRIDVPSLTAVLNTYILQVNTSDIIVALERPMVNPTRFTSSASALRAWEATLIVIEELELPYEIIDSKEWQKVMLPSGIKGAPELKKASRQVGERLFPEFKDIKHPDMDGILIAEYLRKKYV